MDAHNIVAHSVQGHRGAAKQAARRRRCSVGHAIAPQYPGSRRRWAYTHRWTDWPVGTRRTDGRHSVPLDRCVNCGKTVREILILVRPEPPAGSVAHLERALRSGA